MSAEKKWVPCPVCGEPDMEFRPERDSEGKGYIECVNLACWSNGGDSIKPKLAGQPMSADDIAKRLYAVLKEYVAFSEVDEISVPDRLEQVYDDARDILSEYEAYRANPSGWIPVSERSDKERLDWLLSVIREKGVDGLLELPWRLVDDDPESDPEHPEDEPERLTPVLDRSVIDDAMRELPPPPQTEQKPQRMSDREWAALPADQREDHRNP